jgi:hypothetical protein
VWGLSLGSVGRTTRARSAASRPRTVWIGDKVDPRIGNERSQSRDDVALTEQQRAGLVSPWRLQLYADASVLGARETMVGDGRTGHVAEECARRA